MKHTFLILILTASAFAQVQIQYKAGVEAGAMMEKRIGGPVKGSPYSATIVTETTQTLADGNRISQKTSSFVARDSMGRMRTEISIPKFNGLNVEGKAPQMVMITDATLGEVISLNTSDKTYTKRGAGPQRTMVVRQDGEMVAFKMDQEKKAMAEMEASNHSLAEPSRDVKTRVFTNTTGAMAKKVNTNVRQESLGMKVIEGVAADGFRTIETIPAGSVGNDKPIEIVSEMWTSTDLNAVVYSRRSDPRSGEQIMTLTNISRNEPAASLFSVPADYHEGRDMPVTIRMKSNE